MLVWFLARKLPSCLKKIELGLFDENRRAIEILRRNRLIFEDLFGSLFQKSSTENDILEIVRYLIELKNGRGSIDAYRSLGEIGVCVR